MTRARPPILHIKKTREAETGSEFPKAAAGEGKLAGYIGLKPEAKEPFSFSIGDSDITRLLFQLFVEDVRAVKGDKNV
ncbi:hypothetical protein OG250_45435 [Streptomyces sp. NBC_00487]|uniref:hypothetical protein n=1 Tax=unclassified Streptomyces TaxID=2593676 RepID=UPI002E1965CE|nr:MULTISPECIES: hypothetical protein [unclassified Streptomyces]